MSKDLTVNLVANTSQFKSAMSESSNQMKLINSEFRSASAETDKYGNAMDKTGAKKKQLNSLMEQQKVRIQAIKNEQRHWTNELKKGNITETEHAQKQQELARRLNNTEAEMKKYEGQLKRMNAEGKNTTRTYAEFDQQFREVGTTMRNVGAQVGIVAGAGFLTMKRALGSVVEEAMSFESQMAEVKAVSGATGEEFEQVTQQAKDLGRQTIFTAEQVGEAQAGLARAGFDTNEIVSAMPGLLDLAASSNMELGRASEITSSILRAFSKDASESSNVADVLAKGASTAQIDVEGLGNAMQVVAPVAASMNVEFEDLAAATGIMANNSIEGSKAGRMLRQGMLRLAKPTGEAGDLIEELGINVFDADDNMKSMDKVVGELEKGLEGQTKKQKAAALATIFGSESTAGWSALIEEGSESLKDYIVELENSEGAAADMSDTMQDTAAGSIERMKSGISGLKIELGEALLPYLRQGADLVTEFAERLENMDEATVETIAETALLVTALLGVTTAVAGVVTAVGALMAFAGPVGLAITSGTALLGGLSVAIHASQKRTEHLAAAQAEAKEDALAYGDGLSEGTKKGVSGYKDLLDEARVKMGELKYMSGDEADKTVKEINKAFGQLGDMVAAELEEQKEKLTTAITQVFQVAGETGQKEAEEINKKVIDVINDKIDAHGQAIKKIIEIQEEYGTNTSEMPAKIRDSYIEALNSVDEGMQNFAANQDEMDSIILAVSENKGKISNKIAQGHLKSLNESYGESVKGAQDWRNDMVDELEQGLAQGHISQEEFDKAMLNTEAKTNEMLAKAAQKREQGIGELAGHLDERGRLLDLSTGEELKRLEVAEQAANGYVRTRQETDEEYLARWLEMNQETLNATERYSQATRDTYQQFLEEYLISAGHSKDEASEIAKQLVDESLNELDKGEVEAKGSGSKKGRAHSEGIGQEKKVNSNSARSVVDTTLLEFGKGNSKSQQYGKEKGDSHSKGIGSTKGNNIRTIGDLRKSVLDTLRQGDENAQSSGKNKGDAHSRGVSSTKGSNSIAGSNVSSAVTTALESTTDGGGGLKAGNQFTRGILSKRGSSQTAGKSVATSGRTGLGSVSTSKTGSNFVAGFRGSINSGKGSVWDAAFSLGKKALGALNSSIKTASPSKLTHETGGFFTQGFKGGIEDEEKGAVQQAIKLAKQTYGAFDDEVNQYKHAFESIGLAIEGSKQTLKVEHTLDDKFDDLVTALSNDRNDNNPLKDLLNTTLEQNEELSKMNRTLMQILRKDDDTTLDGKSIKKNIDHRMAMELGW